MKRWIDIIGYEPVEVEESIDPNQSVLDCCNCGKVVKVVNVWSKCEHCNFYNAK
jgi:hypothetical protein